MRLVGRANEQQAIDAVLQQAREGLSGALVLRGEPGIGKTALLDYAAESVPDFQVLHISGVESEVELDFAALDQLCRPLAAHLNRLPDRQADALAISFGVRSGATPDRFLVGLAVLTVLSELAEQGPVLCTVDDVHWLDQASAQALGFVARRLEAESVVLVMAGRSSDERVELSGIPVLPLSGLSDADAGQLLGSVLAGRFDPRVKDRIVAEARGNPLALLELPGSSTPAKMAGGFGILDAEAPVDSRAEEVQGRVEDSFRQRIERLPAQGQRLLLLAAAEPVGDPRLLRAAAQRLGLDADAEAHVEAAGLLRVRGRVVFRHPLVRSAVYRSASDDDRRAVHRAIADVTDPDTDPDHRAWHRAAASADPDEEVAAELERSAERAQARGGLSAAAAFLERATTLTPDLERRARRALAAAHSRLMVGSPDAACRLAAIAEAGPLEPLERARLELLRAKTAVYPTYRATAPQLLVTAARRLAPLDAALCRETYLDAIQAATSAGSLGETGQLRAVAEAALAAPPAPEPPRAVDLFLDGLATRVVDGEAAGVPLLRRALIAFRGETDQRWLWLVIRTTQAIGDDETWHVLVNRQIQVARQTGTLVMLPIALRQLAVLQVYSGRLDDAEATNEEADAIGAAIGVRPVAYGRLALTAWRGRLHKTTPLVDHTISESTTRGEGLAVAAAYQAMAVQYIGLSRYEEAMETALKASSSNEAGYAMLSLPDVIEAAVRTNNCEVATAAMEPLSSIAQAMGTNWALGVVARSRALMSDDRGEIECLHEEAIARLGQTRVVVELARAHLLYGEWLRRQRRRMDARAHLRVAHDMFVAMGAEAFADRVVRELEATGEHARRRSPETTNQLTPQQIQVARLACAGHSNSEIAAQLFISPRTVEYHLRNVYLSLGVTSRGQLAGFLT